MKRRPECRRVKRGPKTCQHPSFIKGAGGRPIPYFKMGFDFSLFRMAPSLIRIQDEDSAAKYPERTYEANSILIRFDCVTLLRTWVLS